MILDALTRAEHERQIEKQPDLNFVTPVKQRKSKPINIGVWVVGALIVNAIVLAVIFRPNSGSQQETTVATEAPILKTEKRISTSTPTAPAPRVESFEHPQVALNDAQTNALDNLNEAQPLEMEIKEVVPTPVDRPLIYEAKSATTQDSQPKVSTELNSSVKKSPSKGAVSFSDQELSVEDNSSLVSNAPKLLIDQDDSISVSSNSSASVPLLKDLPESSRQDLSRYEVNVHVFDDNPERRFVLINMDKYKEGDRIADNGPLVEEITRKGVVVDFGNGRTLLPPK